MVIEYSSMKTSRNWLYGAILALLGAVSVASYAGIASAQPSSLVLQTSAIATTTVAYIGNGTATSTYQIDGSTFSSGKIANLQPIDSISLFVQIAASSTATTLTITPQYSNNGIDWYNLGSQGTASASGSIAVSTSTAFTWTPGTTATTSMVFVLPSVPTNHERVVYSMSGGAGGLYSEYDLKKNPSTP